MGIAVTGQWCSIFIDFFQSAKSTKQRHAVLSYCQIFDKHIVIVFCKFCKTRGTRFLVSKLDFYFPFYVNVCALTIFLFNFCALGNVGDCCYTRLPLSSHFLQAKASMWRLHWAFILLWHVEAQAGNAMCLCFSMCYEMCRKMMYVLYLPFCFWIYSTSLCF